MPSWSAPGSDVPAWAMPSETRSRQTVSRACRIRRSSSTRVVFGTAAELVDRFTELQDGLGIDGIVAELNAGGLIPWEQVQRTLRILTQDVMPALK